MSLVQMNRSDWIRALRAGVVKARPKSPKATPAQLGAAALKATAEQRREALRVSLREAVTAWARTVPEWETGLGFAPGKGMGRPSVWVRMRGAIQ